MFSHVFPAVGIQNVKTSGRGLILCFRHGFALSRRLSVANTFSENLLKKGSFVAKSHCVMTSLLDHNAKLSHYIKSQHKIYFMC